MSECGRFVVDRSRHIVPLTVVLCCNDNMMIQPASSWLTCQQTDAYPAQRSWAVTRPRTVDSGITALAASAWRRVDADLWETPCPRHRAGVAARPRRLTGLQASGAVGSKPLFYKGHDGSHPAAGDCHGTWDARLATGGIWRW
jgi:hypothetical protein